MNKFWRGAFILFLSSYTFLWLTILDAVLLIACLKLLPSVVAFELRLERPFPLGFIWLIWGGLTPVIFMAGLWMLFATGKISAFWERVFFGPKEQVAPNYSIIGPSEREREAMSKKGPNLAIVPGGKPMKDEGTAMVAVSMPLFLFIMTTFFWVIMLVGGIDPEPNTGESVYFWGWNATAFMNAHAFALIAGVSVIIAAIGYTAAIQSYRRLKDRGYYRAIMDHHLYLITPQEGDPADFDVWPEDDLVDVSDVNLEASSTTGGVNVFSREQNVETD